jgi:hypothetical protein
LKEKVAPITVSVLHAMSEIEVAPFEVGLSLIVIHDAREPLFQLIVAQDRFVFQSDHSTVHAILGFLTHDQVEVGSIDFVHRDQQLLEFSVVFAHPRRNDLRIPIAEGLKAQFGFHASAFRRHRHDVLRVDLFGFD